MITLTMFLVSCNELNLDVEVPKCIEREIRKIKRDGVRNPPAKVWQWTVDESTYYYITSDCCDQFNYLYDSNCNIVCSPDGGFSGGGDGKCPNFKGQIVKTLVWEDGRN